MLALSRYVTWFDLFGKYNFRRWNSGGGVGRVYIKTSPVSSNSPQSYNHPPVVKDAVKNKAPICNRFRGQHFEMAPGLAFDKPSCRRC